MLETSIKRGGRFLPSVKKKAFTLAEVLITLSIVGIVSAMTVPNMVNNVQEYGLRNAFLKAYSDIKQANKIASQNEDVLNYGQNIYAIDYDQLERYYKIAQKRKYAQNASLTQIYGFTGKNAQDVIKFLNGKTFQQVGYEFAYNLVVPYSFQMKNGTIVVPMVSSGFERAVYLIDVNGQGGPNQVGKDIYFLQMTNRAADNYWKALPDYDIQPYGSPTTGNVWSSAPTVKNHDCKKNQLGLSCAYHIVTDKGFKIPKN